MKNHNNKFYETLLADSSFKKVYNIKKYPPLGQCWELNENIGKGYYWMYFSEKGYNIKIHDFHFNEDTPVNMSIPECLSVTWYDSIAGEELTPYRQLKSRVIKSFLGGYKPFVAVIHKDIPLYSVGIEYEPMFYETQLSDRFKELYKSPHDIFRSLNETTDFPEMKQLLYQIRNYQGSEISADLFYDSKVTEALALLFERHLSINSSPKLTLPIQDQEMMKSLAAYIDNHCAENLSIEMLSKIACMGTTKLKKNFKAYFDITIAEYITESRIGRAEHLLCYTDLPVGQISKAVGYVNPGYFAELFRKQKGILPLEYRKLKQK